MHGDRSLIARDIFYSVRCDPWILCIRGLSPVLREGLYVWCDGYFLGLIRPRNRIFQETKVRTIGCCK